MPLLDPATVWMVRAGTVDAIRGTLALERHTLTFTANQGEAVPIPVNRIREVRRLRLSPVLEVAYTDARAELATMLLYFAEPPPLPGRGSGPPGRLPLFRPRGLERTVGGMRMRGANRVLKQRVSEWSEKLREAAGLG